MAAAQTPPSGTEDVPAMDFTTFVLSLAANARVGEGEGPEAVEDYVLACQTLDILRLLEEKTQGNLTGEEERVLLDLVDQLDKSCRACRLSR